MIGAIAGDIIGSVYCQSAFKIDPLTASNIIRWRIPIKGLDRKSACHWETNIKRFLANRAIIK